MSDYESEDSVPAKSLLFDATTFKSGNAAYVYLNVNLDKNGKPRHCKIRLFFENFLLSNSK
jgi:hypothetical protein